MSVYDSSPDVFCKDLALSLTDWHLNSISGIGLANYHNYGLGFHPELVKK